MWNQVYNPFNNVPLSTIAAAMPVVTLLALIASGKVKAHIAAHCRVDRSQSHRDLHLHHACEHVATRDGTWRSDRLLPDRLDRVERHLSLPADVGEGRVRDAAEHDRQRY
jgi:hypothetical protein